jgi:hypothetical protein
VKTSTFQIRITGLLTLGALVAGMTALTAGAYVGRGSDVRDAAAATNATVPDIFERYMEAHFKHEDALYRSPIAASGQSRSASATEGGAGVGDGFDWSDYSVGIGTGIGLVLLLAGGVTGARQRRGSVDAA